MAMDRQIKKRKWPPKKIALVAGVVAFAAFAVYVLLFAFRTPTLNVKKDRLTIAAVTKGPFQEFIPVMGTVMPKNSYILTANEAGRVEEVYREAGTMVKKGDRLLKMTNPQTVQEVMWRESDFYNASNNLRQTRLNLEQYKMSLRRDLNDVENQLQQQKRTFDRYEQMHKSELISDHDYELAKDQYNFLVKKKEITLEGQKSDLEFREAQLKALEDAVARLADSLSLVRERLENLYVKAPISGYLTALNPQIGEFRTAGQPLGQIDVLDSNKVRAQVDESYLPRVAEGLVGKFTLGLDSDRTGAESYNLVVRKVYPEVLNNRFEFDLEFQGREPRGITRGQTLHIQLLLGGLAEAILLPRGGFYESTGGNWVFVVDPSGKFALRRTIKLGRQNPQDYEVLEGLKPGEKAVTSSYENYGKIERLVLK